MKFKTIVCLLTLVYLFAFACDKKTPVSNNDTEPVEEVAPMVFNGGFEEGTLEGWTQTGETAATVSVSTSEARSDSFCAKVDGGAGLQQKVTGLLPNTRYQVLGYIKIGTSTRAVIGIKDYGDRDYFRKVRETDYFEFSHSFTTGDTNTSAVLYFGNDRDTGTVFGDDFSVEQEATPPADGANAYAPKGFKWEKIENLSDEFDSGFDTQKWIINSPTWAGRKPGLFKESQVKVADGNLMITADILPFEEQVNGWTHAGGLVRSRFPAFPSYSGYFECRMKANKTFMSSTFWLINDRSNATGCDQRVTELDIQECVGQVTTSSGWAQSFDSAMHSNTHSRNVTCDTPTGSAGNNVPVGGKVWADYHTYGAWWKSPTEIIFYLDGVEQFVVTPPAEFSLDMYLRMVVETYDWNPVPGGGGMGGSEAERTTYYDWVRCYQLVEE